MSFRIMLLSSHFYFSKKRAGFHHLADEYLKKGFEVVFVTVPYSFLKLFGLDGKISQTFFVRNIFLRIKRSNLTSVINFSLTHPTTKNLWNDRLYGFFINKRVLKEVIGLDFIIFESNASLYFFEKIKKVNPSARLIYRVSDDLLAIGVQKSLVKQEERVLNDFDIVSVPNELIYRRLYEKSPGNIFLHHHGVDFSIFDNEKANPYAIGTVNAVFVGNSHFDHIFLEVASRLFRKVDFHIIGNVPKKIQKVNVLYYDEIPFSDTIKFIKFADIGLQARAGDSALLGTLANSNKVEQYLYCRLPIIAPVEINTINSNFFLYERNEKSISSCINRALSHEFSDLETDVNSWEWVAKELVGI